MNILFVIPGSRLQLPVQSTGGQVTRNPSLSKTGSRLGGRDDNQNRGFTLMELLIVIALIGILVTMGVASYQTAQVKSRDARRKTDMKVYQNAFEQYYADNNGTYPPDLGALTTGGSYLPEGVPIDPKPDPYPGYAYSQPTGLLYCVCAKMENSVGNASDNACSEMGTCGGACGNYCVRNLQ